MPILKSVNLQAMVHYADFDLSKVCFDLNETFANKPRKALWTSDWNNNIEEIAWIEWAKWEDFQIKEFLYKVVPKEKVKVYEVSSYEDYYSKKLPKTGNYKNINYVELQERGFDGFRVTRSGAWLGHNFGDRGVLQLNAFDCESTVWFNTNWIKTIEKIMPLNSAE